VFILVDLKCFVFSTRPAVSEVFILIGLKSFVLIQIRECLEVFILHGLWVGRLGCADSKGLRSRNAEKGRPTVRSASLGSNRERRSG